MREELEELEKDRMPKKGRNGRERERERRGVRVEANEGAKEGDGDKK